MTSAGSQRLHRRQAFGSGFRYLAGVRGRVELCWESKPGLRYIGRAVQEQSWSGTLVSTGRNYFTDYNMQLHVLGTAPSQVVKGAHFGETGPQLAEVNSPRTPLRLA